MQHGSLARIPPINLLSRLRFDRISHCLSIPNDFERRCTTRHNVGHSRSITLSTHSEIPTVFRGGHSHSCFSDQEHVTICGSGCLTDPAGVDIGGETPFSPQGPPKASPLLYSQFSVYADEAREGGYGKVVFLTWIRVPRTRANRALAMCASLQHGFRLASGMECCHRKSI